MNKLNNTANLTENEKIFAWLDKYISGQDEAKKSLITIISCMDRRNKLPESELKQSIKPSHAIFHGPTGCGKSYLISKLSEYKQVPFIKTEATTYTEVGYVGRDVEMMIKDLIENSVNLVRKKHIDLVKEKVQAEVYHKIITSIIKEEENTLDIESELESECKESNETNNDESSNFSDILNHDRYDELYEQIKNTELDNKEIEIEIEEEQKSNEIMGFDMPGSNQYIQMAGFNISDMLNKVLGKKNTKKKITKIKDAIELMTDAESKKLINENQIIKEAIHLAQNHGIIFIDEIDKIISTHNTNSRGEVSKEGVQRDLLPLLDGTTINTKYGPIKTDHILFIAAGAFHVTKFSDLLPELQGRFPLSVKLHPLSGEHFIDILLNKKHSLIEQQKLMLEIDKVNLIFASDAVETIAKIAEKMNQEIENTGARRLRAIIDKIFEEINFDSEKHFGQEFYIDSEYIKKTLLQTIVDMDLRKFIL